MPTGYASAGPAPDPSTPARCRAGGEPHQLDEALDLGLGVAQAQPAPVGAQALGEDRQVEDQRRVRERQVGEVDHQVSAPLERPREGVAAQPLGGESSSPEQVSVGGRSW
jgi:hypothetical protein